MDLSDTGEMIVKRVSVPIGLEEMMEGLVKEVLLKKPDDIYFFAAKYFSQLLLRRDKGQTKVKTIRSAQSLTDQREKHFQTKIPVSGVTKQLSRQFSIRGEAPIRNFDSPIVSQKPKMFDRSESKNKRRNTGPPTIPENHMKIAVRKKYSRSVSTERKRETGHSDSTTKRNVNRKETKEMQDESNDKSARNKNGDKRNSVNKELQKNFNLTKNIPIGEVVPKFLGQKNISEKAETVGDSKSVTEIVDSNSSVQSNNEIQQVLNENVQPSTELLVHDDLALLSEKTAVPVEKSNVENSKRELEHGRNISKDGSADESINKINNSIDGIMNTNDDDEQRKHEATDGDEKSETMEHLSEVNVKNSDEILKVDSKIDTLSEQSKSPSDTLDNLTMASENADISINKESRSVSLNSYENDNDAINNSEFTNASKLADEDLNTVKEDSTATKEENGQHKSEVTTNEGNKTEELLGDDIKEIDIEISNKEEPGNNNKKKIPLLMNTNRETSENLKNALISEQLLLKSIPTTHTETRETDNDLEPSIKNGISNEINIDSSDRNETNESNIKTEQRGDSDNQEIGEGNRRENIIEEKVVDDNDTEKENFNKEEHGGVNDLQHISVDDVQEKINTETPIEHKIMPSEISLQNAIAEHDSNVDTPNKVVYDEEGKSEERGVNKISGKGTDHSSSENEISGMNSNDGMDMKDDSEESHDDVIINKKSSSTENSRDESFESHEKSFKQSSMEHEGVVMDNEIPEIITNENSCNENNKIEKKELEPNDQQFTEEQSNTKGTLKETSDSLSDKEHDEVINKAKDVSERDKLLENIIDKAKNVSISKNDPVEDEKLTKELLEDNMKSNKEKGISDINSTTDKESFDNAGKEEITKRESNGKEENRDEQSTEQSETKTDDKHPLHNDNDSNDVSEDKLIRKENNEEHNIEIDTTEINELFANTSKENEMDEIDEKSVTPNLKENLEKTQLNDTKTDPNNAVRNDINPSEVTENITIHKEMEKLNNSDTVANEEKEKLDEEKSVFERNGYGSADITNKKEDIRLSKMNDEYDHNSVIDGSSRPEQNSELEDSILEQGIDNNEDVENILNGPNQSKRNKRSLGQENEISKNSQDFDTDLNFKSEHESSSDSKEIEKESNTEANSGDLKLNHEISQPVHETESKEVSVINDEKQEVTDTSDNETNVGMIDKVAKNYINYVIDKENYLKYNDADADNEGKEDDTPNITNGLSDDMPKNTSKQQNEFDENQNNTDNQSSFDRLKLREELGIPSMEEPNNFEREELKKNIRSTLSVDTPVKTFINNFIGNERNSNEKYKMQQSTKEESEEIIAESEDHKKDANSNGLQSTKSFDRSKLREELQKIEQESKFTSFKPSFNSSLLRQELEHAALLTKPTKTNGYSGTLAKAAAVVRIQSMWRGFIVRKSFPKPQYDEEFSVRRDENSNVYQKKNQEPIESKMNTASIEDKGNNEDPMLMEAVATIQRCWRGFKVRKHLNSIGTKQNFLESARIKRHVDDKNIDYFDTMLAAVKIQKIFRGYIARKKLNIIRNIGQETENEKVVDGTNQILSVNTEKTHSSASHESIPKIIPESESNMHGEMTSGENANSENTSNFSAHKSNEDDKKIEDYATKIQSLWRGFLVRKYVKQLKKQMENKKDGGTHITEDGNFPKDESQRPASMDSNDSSNTVIFNDINKKSGGVKTHDDHWLGYTMNHRDIDGVDESLDEILDYPLIKDEHEIDDYQNKLLDRISGKQNDSGSGPDKTVETVLSKRIEEIKAEDLKDIGALHTSLLLSSAGQDRNESQVEQIHSRSKLESVTEESASPTAEDMIDSKTDQATGMTTTTTTEKQGVDSEAEESKLSFCSEPSAPPRETKVIDGKPLSDHVEEIETKQKSFSSREYTTTGYNEKDDADVEPSCKIDATNHVVQHAAEENAEREFGSVSDENAQLSDLKNVKLLHSGEWHDSIVIPLPKVVTESLKSDTQKERIGYFQESEASEKSVDSTADLSSILSNSSAGLLHTGEMHDGIMVPISLSSLGRTISSGGENDGIDTVDSRTQALQNPEIQTCNDTTNNGLSSVAVQVLQAPEPEVLTSPKPVTAAGDVTRADEGRRAQTPNKEDLRIQSELSSPVSQSMACEGARNTEQNNMEVQAATKIQAGFRGYQVRKQLKLKNGSSDMNPPKRQCRVKCSGRPDSAKSQSCNRTKDVEEKSAVKIQAGVRGFLVRRRQKKQNNQEL